MTSPVSGTCKRCGRALKGSSSLERGYGPVCFRKVQQDCEKVESKLEPCSIEYPGLALHVKEKIWERVLQGEKKTCSCGEPLKTGELRSYDHDGGWDLKGFSKPQWPYILCSNCGHQLSIHKLRIDLSDLEKIKSKDQKQAVSQVV